MAIVVLFSRFFSRMSCMHVLPRCQVPHVVRCPPRAPEGGACRASVSPSLALALLVCFSVACCGLKTKTKTRLPAPVVPLWWLSWHLSPGFSLHVGPWSLAKGLLQQGAVACAVTAGALLLPGPVEAAPPRPRRCGKSQAVVKGWAPAAWAPSLARN